MVDISTLFCIKRLPSQDTNAFSDSSYGRELGLPLFLLLLTRSDRLAPYCSSTLLAGTHNYLAGIHYYFFTILTMTTVPHGLPLGGWYCTISVLFFRVCGQDRWPVWPPQDFNYAEPGQHRAVCMEPFTWLILCLIFDLSFYPHECAMGFPDSSCLFFDLIPFIYLLS